MASVGEYRDGDGWGVIDGPDVPGGCWVHFSAIAKPGYKSLTAGQAVTFRFEQGWQDGYAYRAEKVWTGDAEPPDEVYPPPPPGVYWSELTLTFDDDPEGYSAGRSSPYT